MNCLLTIILVWLGLLSNHATLPIDDNDYPIDENDYRAAKYSTVIDYSKIHYISPNLPARSIAYRYYIQYGKNVVIELTDPGNDIAYMAVILVKWDYDKKHRDATFILDHVKKYYTQPDTILFSNSDKKGTVRSLCSPGISVCDSVLYSPKIPGLEYKIHFRDSSRNITSHELFYPDIQGLPYEIISQGSKRRVRTLEEVIIGKDAVDSLLNIYSHKGYSRITEEEMKSLMKQFPPESYKYMLPKD